MIHDCTKRHENGERLKQSWRSGIRGRGLLVEVADEQYIHDIIAESPCRHGAWGDGCRDAEFVRGKLVDAAAGVACSVWSKTR
ncbi:predicted protein [Sclerotinia sclerotiorum 1980 UF-70]|uniref:Uncharacterized protein n=1 Tax=Sclerotinia sclerotiorum (strain ATCC 18683 / 1980 / Ss-1) TaxID=665079 RepID=A7EGH1_SCLS1|nr:predicted protein [Sclerotinia sclerotiorum 1980 UF-70]EDO01937.1 predicted protein [Sclerotinia sclerotiorum 1980 UF-70]